MSPLGYNQREQCKDENSLLKQATPIKKLSSIHLEDDEQNEADMEDELEHKNGINSKHDTQHGRLSLEKILEEHSDEQEGEVTILDKNDGVSIIGLMDDSSDSSLELYV